MPSPAGSAGYSHSPLIKKLGLKSHQQIILVNAPYHYLQLLETDPTALDAVGSEGIEAGDFIHFFTNDRKELASRIGDLKKKLRIHGMLWISWPKAKSRILKDIMEQDVRNSGL